MNDVEREPVPTRVLNPNGSEASYKPKQRSYRKTKQKKNIFLFLFLFGGILVGGIFPWNHSRQAIRYAGVIKCNNLPEYIKASDNQETFKQRYKKFLLEQNVS